MIIELIINRYAVADPGFGGRGALIGINKGKGDRDGGAPPPQMERNWKSENA